MPTERSRRIAFDMWHDFTELARTPPGSEPAEVQRRTDAAFAALNRIMEALDLQAAETGREFTVDDVRFTRIDTDGDYDWHETRYFVEGPTRAAVRAAVAKSFEPFSCGPHSYHCCGREFRTSEPGLVFTAGRTGRVAAIAIDRLARDV